MIDKNMITIPPEYELKLRINVKGKWKEV